MSPISTLRFILSHPLNRGRSISAISRYVGWQARSRLHDEVIVDWIEGTKLAARNGMTGATGNIYCGLHEYEDMSFLLHMLRPEHLFVDVGANIGSYSLLASGVCGARSIAIEPDPLTARYLQGNVLLNGLGHLVSVQRTAVGEREGSISFTVGKDTTNRIAKPSDRNVQSVKLQQLDTLLRNEWPAFIKFDVEGYEGPVLRGARETLAKSSLKAVALETVDSDIVASLEHHGFRQAAYHPRDRMLEYGRGSGVNTLFVRDLEALNELVSSAETRTWKKTQI